MNVRRTHVMNHHSQVLYYFQWLNYIYMQCFSTLSEDDCRHQILSFITTWASKPWLVLHDVCIIFNTKVKGFHIYDSNPFVITSILLWASYAQWSMQTYNPVVHHSHGIRILVCIMFYCLLIKKKIFFFLQPQLSLLSSLPG
jgi:hypothetical protein